MELHTSIWGTICHHDIMHFYITVGRLGVIFIESWWHAISNKYQDKSKFAWEQSETKFQNKYKIQKLVITEFFKILFLKYLKTYFAYMPNYIVFRNTYKLHSHLNLKD